MRNTHFTFSLRFWQITNNLRLCDYVFHHRIFRPATSVGQVVTNAGVEKQRLLCYLRTEGFGGGFGGCVNSMSVTFFLKEIETSKNKSISRKWNPDLSCNMSWIQCSCQNPCEINSTWWVLPNLKGLWCGDMKGIVEGCQFITQVMVILGFILHAETLRRKHITSAWMNGCMLRKSIISIFFPEKKHSADVGYKRMTNANQKQKQYIEFAICEDRGSHFRRLQPRGFIYPLPIIQGRHLQKPNQGHLRV